MKMESDYIAKTKTAFNAIKQDISEIKTDGLKVQKNLLDLEKKYITLFEKQNYELTKYKDDIKKDFEKNSTFIHNDLLDAKGSIIKFDSSLKKHLESIKSDIFVELDKHDLTFKSLDKDISMLNSNFSKVLLRLEDVEHKELNYKKYLDKISKSQADLDLNCTDVKNLKKSLTKSLNEIHFNSIQIKEIQKQIVEDKNVNSAEHNALGENLFEFNKINSENFMSVKESFDSSKSEINSEIETISFNLNTQFKQLESQLLDKITLMHKELEYFKTDNESLKNEISSLKKELKNSNLENIKLNKLFTKIETKLIGLKTNVSTKNDAKFKESSKVDSNKSLSKRTKDFLFNLFFEEVEIESVDKDPSSTKKEKIKVE